MKRLIALALCLVLVLIPLTSLAAGTGAIRLDTSGIADPTAAAYHYVYYGDNGSPLKWRVLDADTTNTGAVGMLLFADDYLGLSTGHQFDSGGAANYKGSGIQGVLETNTDSLRKTNFSTAEQAAMLATTKSDTSYTASSASSVSGGAASPYASTDILSGDKLFLLSLEEADTTSYFPNGNADRSKAYEWWLRSFGGFGHFGNVRGSGADNGKFDTSNYYAGQFYRIRPAFNLGLSDVLFTSAAAGAKSASGMDGGLTAVPTTAPTEWKLTLKDNANHSSFAVSTSAVSAPETGGSVSVDYTGAASGTGEYISAILMNGADAAYYGRLGSVAAGSESGTLSFNIPAGLARGAYTLKLFNEKYCGDNKTDYSSDFVDVTLTVTAAPPSVDITTDSFVQGRAPANETITVASTLSGFNATNNFASATLGSHTLDLGSVGTPGTEGSVADGSILIRLNQAYLNTLAVGSHTLTVNLAGAYAGQSVNTTITVTQRPVPPQPYVPSDNPGTGDTANVAVWAFAAIIAAGAITICIRKRTND